MTCPLSFNPVCARPVALRCSLPDGPNVSCNMQLSLWDRLGGLNVVQRMLWPLLDDSSALKALRMNRSSYMTFFYHYPISHEWTLDQLMDSMEVREQALYHGLQLPAPRVLRAHIGHSLEMLHVLQSLTHVTMLDSNPSSLDLLSHHQQLRDLTLEWAQDCEDSLLRGSLPPHLTHLTLDGYNAPLLPGVLPLSLLRLVVGDSFDQSLAVGVLPSGLTHLTLASEKVNDAWSGWVRSRRDLVSHITHCDSIGRFNQILEANALPPALTHLTLGCQFDQRLPSPLPSSLTSIVMQSSPSHDYHGDIGFNQPLTLASSSSSSSLTYLHLPPSFNQPLDIHSLSPSLIELHFGSGLGFANFNQSLLPSVLPSSLLILDLTGNFNQPLGFNVLPCQLSILKLGDAFDHPLLPGTLPASLEELILGMSFSHAFDVDVLPGKLQKLVMAGYPSQHSFQPGVLPASLTFLDITSTGYNAPFVADTLPASLRCLYLSSTYNQPFNVGSFACCLELLRLPRDGLFNQPFLPGVLPPSLLEIELPSRYAHRLEVGSSLPSHLTVLKIHLDATYSSPGGSALELGCLPSTMSSLHLSNHQLVQDLNESPALPASLRYFIWDCPSPTPWQPGVLLSGLTEVHLGESFNQPLLPHVLPATLKLLRFGNTSKWNHPLIASVLPNALESLYLTSFNQTLGPGSLPPSLHYLCLGSRFNHRLLPGALPASLHTLAFSGSQYDHEIEPATWPADLAVVYIHTSYAHPIPCTCIRKDNQLGWGPKEMMTDRF